MSDTTVAIQIGDYALTPAERDRIRSVDILEAQGAQTQISIVTDATVDGLSNWTTPLDPLVWPFAPFTIRLKRDQDEYVVEARAISASWRLTAGAPSTLTVAGLDSSADLGREQVSRSWDGTTDTAIAQKLLGPTATVADSAPASGADDTPLRQLDTDWDFLRRLARRNDFDVHLEYSGDPVVTRAVFGPIDHEAAPSWTLDLGHGGLGGTATAEVQLVAGRHVTVVHAPDPSSGEQVRTQNRGTARPMGTTTLGGAVKVQLSMNDAEGTQTPEHLARVSAEQSAFAATLTTTLSAPAMPLVRARRTVRVRGLGPILSGRWLVKSVRHSMSPGGHTQAVTLVRNALGDDTTAGALGAAAGAAANGADITAAIAAVVTAATAEAAGARASVL